MERKPVYSFPGPACWEDRHPRFMGAGLFEFLKDSSTIPYTPNLSSITTIVDYMAEVLKIKPSRLGRNTGPFITAPCDGVIQDRPMPERTGYVSTFIEMQLMAQLKYEQELALLYSRDNLERFKLQHQINQLSCQENM